jgi:hypothetical protein
MKKNSEFQKVVSILLISVFVTTTSGCYSVKILTTNDIPYSDKSRYTLHGTSVKYNLNNAVISEGYLTGSIEDQKNIAPKNEAVHFYVSPDSAIIITGDSIKVPFGNIKKIEVREFSTVITAILGGIIILTVIGMIYAVKNIHFDAGTF